MRQHIKTHKGSCQSFQLIPHFFKVTLLTMFSVNKNCCLFSLKYEIAAEDIDKARVRDDRNMSPCDRFWHYIADLFTPSEVLQAREHLKTLFQLSQRCDSTPAPGVAQRCDLERRMYSAFAALQKLATEDCKDNFIFTDNQLILITNNTKKRNVESQRLQDQLAEQAECPTLEIDTIQLGPADDPVLRATLKYYNGTTGKVNGAAYKSDARKEATWNIFNSAVVDYQPISKATITDMLASLDTKTALKLRELNVALIEVSKKNIGSANEKKKADFYLQRIRQLQTLAKTEGDTNELENIREELIASIQEARRFLTPIFRQLETP